MTLITTTEAATELNVTRRRILQLCLGGRIKGARKFGPAWMIPSPVRVTAVKRGRPFKAQS